MKAVDVMTRNVVSVKLDSSVFEAAQRMILNRISGLPVLDASGNLVGVVTEGDLLRRAETATERHRPSWLEFFLGQGRLATEYVRTHGRKVGDVMTPGPETIVEETPLDEMVTVMEQKRIKRLPVMRGDRQDGWDCQSGQPRSGAGDPGSRNRRHPSQRYGPSGARAGGN